MGFSVVQYKSSPCNSQPFRSPLVRHDIYCSFPLGLCDLLIELVVTFLKSELGSSGSLIHAKTGAVLEPPLRSTLVWASPLRLYAKKAMSAHGSHGDRTPPRLSLRCASLMKGERYAHKQKHVLRIETLLHHQL